MGKLTGVYKASDLNAKKKEEKTAAKTGSGGASISGVYNAAGLKAKGQQLKEIKKEQNKKAISEREPMTYGEGDALTNPLYVGKGSTWKGAESFANLNKLNVNGAEELAERKQIRENNVRIRQIDREIEQAKTEKTKQTRETKTAFGTLPAAGREKNVQDAAKIANYTDVTALQAEKNRLVNKNQRLGVGVKTYEDKQQYDRIVKNGDEALFSKLFDLDYSEQGGRLSGAFLSAQGITQNNGASFQQWNRIAEELNSKGYDVNKAYAAYKNERLRQETEEEKEQFGQFAAAHPVAATALGVATAPIRGTAGVIGMAMEPGQANSPYQLFNTYSGAVTEKVGEISNQTVQTLAKMTGLNGGAAKALGKGAQWIYNAGVASLESLLTMETGGPLGELLMASGAASQAYNEALNNGLDNAHALGTSVLAGVFEAAFEHISLEKLRGLQAADAPGLKTAIINVLKQFLTEGSEEVFTDVANELADYLLNGGLSNYERTVSDYMKNGMTREQANAKYAGDFGWQLVESMAVGGLSGAMSAGKIQTSKVASEAVENYGIGKRVQKEAKAGGTSVQDVLSPLAKQLDSESKGSRMLAAVNEKSKPGKIGKAATQAMYEMREANRETIAEAFRASGMESEKAGKAAEMYNKFINKEALTGKEWKLFTDGDVQDVIAELVKEGSTLANRQAAYKEFEQNVLDAVRRNAPGRKVADKLEKQFGDGEVVKAVKTGDILEASDKALKNDRIDEDLVNTTEVKIADGKAQARQIAGLTDGDLDVVVDESGATEKLENINFGEDEAALKTKAAYIMLRDMMAGKEDFKTPLNATAANLALALWQNADAATNEKVSQASFLRQFYSAYVAGSVLADIKTLGVNESYTLPAEVLDVAYKAGAKQYELKPGVTNISRNVLNAVQQAEMYLLDMDAQKTGKRYLFHSEMEDYGYDDKSKAAVTYKLYGSTSGNDIIIALKTGEVENILTLTAGHETFHWIGTIDRNAQRALTNMVIEHLKSRSDIDYDAIYEQRARAYEGQSREFIEEEIAAQYFGTLWADKGFQRRMAKTDVKLAQRVLDYIKQFFERIHERIMEYAEKTGDKTIKAALLTEETEARKQLKAFEGVIEHVLAETKTESAQETKESLVLDQAYDEQYAARQEVSALERQIRDIEQSEEFNKVMDALAAGLSGENFEEALEQYNRYAEQSGYAELTAKIADARERVKTAEQNYNEVFATEAAEAERAAIEKSGLTEAEYFRKAAVKEFGTTSEWREAGYLTEDGRLLNFSGEKNMHRGNRGQDHRGIGIIFEDTHGSEAMYRFMRYGNIRVIAETPGVDICTNTEPTAQQYAKIKDMVRRFAGEKLFNVDLTDENGRAVGALEYEGNVSADRVVNDIKHYFETGEIREQSSVEKFRYSKVLDQAYEKAVDDGDEAKQAALVEQAAKAAGYNLHLYHGAKSGGGFTVFKDWQYFTGNKAYAERYTLRDRPESLYDVYVKADRMFDTRRPECKKIFEQYKNEYGMSDLMESGLPDWTDGYDISDFIEENDLPYDGIVLDEGGDMTANGPVSRGPSYVIRQSNQIKSAEPITYDDEGNVIPLSERFNSEKTDIRFSRMLNQNAVEYVNRITNGSRQYDEITELLGELAADTYEEGKARLTPAKITELAKKYNLSGMDRKELQAFAERLGKADAMLGDGENADTVLYGLYRIMREQVINAGHYEDTGMDNVKEFRREFRVNGHAINLYIPADVQTDVAEYYGGKAALRRTMFGKMNIVYDQSKANSSLDEFYQELLAKNYGLEETTDPTTQLNNLLGLYSADTRVWMNDTEGLGLAGESVEEIATDKAVQLMTDMLTAGRKSASVKENAARIDKLLTKEQQNRAEGISSVITKADERLQKRLAALEQSELDTIEIERERERLKAENRLQTIREAYRQRLVQEQRRYAEEKQKEALAKDVKRNLKALSDRFLKESDALHVPEDLKKSVMEFVRMFDMDRTMLTANAMYNLNRIASRLTQSRQDETKGETQAGDEDLMGRFDADIRADIEELARAISVIENERNGRKIYTSMLTLDEMRKLSNVMEHIRFLVESANEAFVNGKKQKISAISDKLIDDLKGKHPKLVQRLATVDGFINNKMLTPVYFFREKIGSTMREIYDDFRDGQDEWYRRVAEGGKMLHDAKEKYHYKNWKDEKKHFHLDATLEQDAWDVDLSVEAIMQIYVTAKREVAAGMDSKHLMTGGIVLADEAKLKSKREKLAAWLKNAKNAKGLTAKGLQAEIERQAEAFEKEQNAERRQITLGKLIEIGDMLTDEQKAYADAVVRFMSTTCSDWGNGATMQLSGIKKFTEQYYFPFQSAKNYLHTSLGVMDDTRLKNAGFTKRTVHGAASPLVISGFTDVAASHIEQMALFSTMTVPLDNLSRVYNYQATSIDEQGNITKAAGNVKTAIQNAYGKAALDYINTFVRGVNGGLRSNSLDNMWNKATSMFKRAAVTGNASVVIQQPTSLMRAMALIHPRYFLGVPRIGDYKNMMEHAPVAGIKKMGGFDTNTGRSAVDFMIDEQTTLQKATEWLNIGAEAADMVTWTNIWNAVRRETSHEHPDLEYGSDAYYKQCYARFRDIIDYTQVYDSTLSKSELMRDPGGLTKMITAFMAEPTLSFNMLTQSGMHRNGRTVNKGAAIVAFLFNIAVNSAFQSVVGAWRDKDEDETYREKWLKRFFGNLVGDKNVKFLDGAWSPLTMLPWVKDLISIAQGYDVDRSDISVFSDLFDTWQDFWEKMADGEALTLEDYKEIVGTVSQLTPVPLTKIIQDGFGIWNTADAWIHSGMQNTRETAVQAILDGLGYSKSNAEKAYDAMVNNNEEYIRRKLNVPDEEVQAYIDKGYSEVNARTNAQVDRETKLLNLEIAGVVAMDERAQAAAEARYARDHRTYENLIDAMEDDGIDRNAALGAVDRLFKALFPEEDEAKELKDKKLYTTKDLDLAMEAVSVTDFNFISEALGYDEDTREQKARKYAENVYEENADYNKALTILDELGGLSYNEAKAKVDYWKYIALNEDSDVSESAFTKYDGTGLGDLGVTLETWADVSKVKYNMKGDDLNGDGKTDTGSAKKKVLAYINGLNLTRTQKDALYRALGYGEKDIYKAPWH